jgi:hypothetical protein
LTQTGFDHIPKEGRRRRRMMTRPGAAATLSKSIEVSSITTASFPFIHKAKTRTTECSHAHPFFF